MTSQRKIVPTDMRETYHELGEYSIRFILADRSVASSKEMNVTMRDSDGKQMNFATKRWGKKFHVNFVISDDSADGICTITFDIVLRGGKKYVETHSCWIIKP